MRFRRIVFGGAIALSVIPFDIYAQEKGVNFGGIWLEGGVGYSQDEESLRLKSGTASLRYLYDQKAISIGRSAFVSKKLGFSDATDCLTDSSLCAEGASEAMIETSLDYANVKRDQKGVTLSHIGIGRLQGYNITAPGETFDSYGLRIGVTRMEPINGVIGLSGGLSFNFNGDNSFGLLFLSLALGAL